MSRSLSGLSVMVFPSAKKDGLGRTFQEQAHRKRVAVVMVCWFFAALAVMLMTSVQMGAAVLCTALLVFWYYHHMAMKQFGGMTGDLAGYFLVHYENLADPPFSDTGESGKTVYRRNR